MKQFTVEVGPAQPNGGRVRRSALSPDFLLRVPAKSVHTLYDVLKHSVRKHGDRKAFGYRTVEAVVEEEKEVSRFVDNVEKKETKIWKFFQLSAYQYLTYKQVSRQVHAIGSGLVHLGLQEKTKIALFSPTNMHWLLMAHAAFTQNMTIVTAYDTLGEEGLLHAMNETRVEAIYTTAELLPTVAKVAPHCSTLKFVFYTGDAPSSWPHEHINMRVISLDNLTEQGTIHPSEPRPPEPEDLCCIMYTSGSTGSPKGVMLSHKNIVAAIAACHRLLGHLVSHHDSMMAYLPLAHVLEFVVENLLRRCKGDIKEFRPTLMTGVPAVWESIRKGVLAKLLSASPKAQKMFQKAYATKAWLLERHLPTRAIDKIVFSRIKDQLGGRLRFALSGGAPLSLETQKFLSVTVCPILGGFGMTESCGMCSIMSPEQFGYGHVGAPVPCCEIKMVDVPEAGYVSTNRKPQGEIWVRGPAITQGYWQQDDLTRETLTSDGWLQTGDIGEWNENGTLTIIDRKKNLVKLSNGEYIALEKLESIYKSSLYCLNICVHADSLLPRPVALVVPVEAALRRLASAMDVAPQGWPRLCQEPALKSALLRALLAQGKEAGLKPVECLFDIHLCHEEWTTESGLLTAAQKIKRQDIVKRYKDEITLMNAAQKH